MTRLKTARQHFAFWLTSASLIFALYVTAVASLIIFGPGAIRQFGIALLVLFASALLGGLIGFLFGASASGVDGSPETPIHAKSHLAQIADWLTKIIVGVGLVEFRSILSELYEIGAFLNSHLVGQSGANAPQWGIPLAIGMIVSGAIGAFALIYLWTVTRLPEVWRE